MRILAAYFGLAVAALAVACSSDTSTAEPARTSTPANAATAAASASPAADGNTVTVAQFKYAPARLEVTKGTTVTWKNQDAILHTVTEGTPAARGQAFDGQLADSGTSFQYRFEQAGTFAFFCDRHQFMTGEVVVR